MRTLEIVTGIDNTGGNPAAYCIAGRRIVTDAFLPELAAYRLQGAAAWSEPPEPQVMAAAPGDPVTYAGKAWVANAWRDVECRRARRGFDLRFRGLATFWIAEDGSFVYLTDAKQPGEKAILSEIALGTPLMIALALQGVYCLHVSVVQFGERLVAFAGESGQGKSTLGRFLGFESGPAWRRVIDDSLPLAYTASGGVEALPYFPQLKLPVGYQPVNHVLASMRLDALYVLTNDVSREDEVRIDRLATSKAILAVVKHTVASRLFDRHLLEHHLAFAAAVAADIPIQSLGYPRGLNHLPAVRDQLQSDLVDLFKED